MSSAINHFEEFSFIEWIKTNVESFDDDDLTYFTSATVTKDKFGWRILLKHGEEEGSPKELAYIDKDSSINDNLEDGAKISLKGRSFYFKKYPGKKESSKSEKPDKMYII